MRRIAWCAGALLASLAVPQAAGASGDYGCDPSWRLANRSFGSCGNSAVLAPGNDTRVNLFFLLRDRQPAPVSGLSYLATAEVDPTTGHNFFAWRTLRRTFYPTVELATEDDAYGSRCVSRDSGGAAFRAAMAAARGLPAGERAVLDLARGTIAPSCAGGGSAPEFAAPAGIKSTPGREFLGYLEAADAFYGEAWDGARAGFAGLRAAKDGWLAETAAYMLARTELNAAQASAFDEYGSFEAAKVDKAALARARGLFGDYLKRYPAGRYAASAQGLVRRTLWLAGDAVGLAREYERLLGATPADAPAAADLVEEIDNKLLIGSQAAKFDGPLLLATIDLMMMRTSEEGGPPQISAAQIAAQEARFAGRPELYGFVLASHAFYVEKDPAQVLRLIPDDARKPNYDSLGFSRQVLRGMALAARGDRNEVGFWRELLGGAKGPFQRPVVELALALNWERSGRLAEVFAAGSPIGETPIREILIQTIAGPDLLRAQARNAQRPEHERALALFTLLHKQLLYGDFAGFVRDSALVPQGAQRGGGLYDLRMQPDIPIGLFREAQWSDGYPCPTLSATAAALARNPREAKARLCLGDFQRLNGFDQYGEFGVNDTRPARDELGGTPSLFPGKPMPRGDVYVAIVADATAAAGEKAYALYRAVNCYAPSGNNQCGGADVAKAQRQAWFQRLKRDYPQSQWAQKLRYYW
jgi:hypothetical protein